MNIRLTVVVVTAVTVWLGSVAPAMAQSVPPPRPRPFPTTGAQPPAAPTAELPQAVIEGPLGAPMYPNAVFLETIDAGKGGQQYHLFGADVPFDDIVNYYKTTLKNGGRSIFQAPAMHQFDLGRFQEQTMAYPPSVVVKDYLWNGSDGYLHVAGATMRRFRTIIQIVPAR